MPAKVKVNSKEDKTYTAICIDYKYLKKIMNIIRRKVDSKKKNQTEFLKNTESELKNSLNRIKAD